MIAHKVPRLIIAHAFPCRLFVPLQIVDGIGAWFTFHQPVLQRVLSLAWQAPSEIIFSTQALEAVFFICFSRPNNGF